MKELAQQLKELGFGYSRAWCNDITLCEHPHCLFPSLEELIQGCQPYFWDLVSNVTIKKGDEIIEQGGWVADARLDDISAEGQTAVEAVARLWIALKKKNHVSPQQ